MIVDDDVKLLVELVYAQGRAEGYQRAAADAAAADLAWSVHKRLSYEDRVAARLAEMESWARAQPGYRPYPDGWDEQFLAQVQAWVRDGALAAT